MKISDFEISKIWNFQIFIFLLKDLPKDFFRIFGFFPIFFSDKKYFFDHKKIKNFDEIFFKVHLQIQYFRFKSFVAHLAHLAPARMPKTQKGNKKGICGRTWAWASTNSLGILLSHHSGFGIYIFSWLKSLYHLSRHKNPWIAGNELKNIEKRLFSVVIFLIFI